METRLGVLLWSQATSWSEFEATATLVDELGYADLWAWDHLYAIFGDPYQPIFEGYTTLAAWAKVTRRVRLGLLVGANTFRNPAVVAKMLTTIDHASGGRAIAGLGGAWFDLEHSEAGIDFGSGFGQRLDWLDEATAALRAMLDGEAVTSPAGGHYAFDGFRVLPAPVQGHLPILIGGSGERKTLATVARYADAWNTGGDLERVRHKDEVLRRWCAEVGRDESEIERTLQGGSVVIRDTVEEAERAAQAIARQNGLPDFRGAVGPPELIAERLVAQVELGFHHVYFDVPAPYDRETLERLVGEVKPLLARAAATG
jgi:alkanesulfonate monooxygenase SsuD/methylene tetrahydromethanopterin reductase-like flavin-dependent oxidoreductase (luciferase family)